MTGELDRGGFVAEVVEVVPVEVKGELGENRLPEVVWSQDKGALGGLSMVNS